MLFETFLGHVDVLSEKAIPIDDIISLDVGNYMRSIFTVDDITIESLIFYDGVVDVSSHDNKLHVVSMKFFGYRDGESATFGLMDISVKHAKTVIDTLISLLEHFIKNREEDIGMIRFNIGDVNVSRLFNKLKVMLSSYGYVDKSYLERDTKVVLFVREDVDF